MAGKSVMERIARALERVLLEAYSVRLGHCAETLPDPNPANEPTIEYARDEDLAKDKLEELLSLARRGPGRDGDPNSLIEQDRDV